MKGNQFSQSSVRSRISLSLLVLGVAILSSTTALGFTLSLDVQGKPKKLSNGTQPANVAIPNFRFGDKIETSLSAGWYTIEAFLTDGTPLPSSSRHWVVEVAIEGAAAVQAAVARRRLFRAIDTLLDVLDAFADVAVQTLDQFQQQGGWRGRSRALFDR